MNLRVSLPNLPNGWYTQGGKPYAWSRVRLHRRGRGVFCDCSDCGRPVRLDKPILRALHFCR